MPLRVFGAIAVLTWAVAITAVAVVLWHRTITRATTHAAMSIEPATYAGRAVLMIAAHPDDVVGASGGFVAALADAGARVAVLVLTNGDAGCNASLTPAECAKIRAEEEANSDAVLGVHKSNVTVLQRFRDNHLWDDTYPAYAVVREIVTHVRAVQPYAVFTFTPDPAWGLNPSAGYDDMRFHPDHQRAGLLVASTIAGYSCSDAAIYNASLGPVWQPTELWFWAFGSPTVCFPLSDSLLRRKQSAFLQHRSQYSDPSALLRWVATFAGLVAQNCGLAAGEWAEGFRPFLHPTG
jgi:LmbE family N-acetylglucosaminyl deacetylase